MNEPVPNGKVLAQSIWMMWEKGFALLSQLRSKDITQYGICKVIVRKHHGACILCRDGTRISEGDWIGELHLDNGKVLQLLRDSGSGRAALITARLARESLQQISEAMETRPEMAQVKAITGVTLLHRGLTHGLGFEVHTLQSRWFERVSSAYLRLLLRMMHPDGKRRIRRRSEKLVPMMLIHTRSSLRGQFPQICEA